MKRNVIYFVDENDAARRANERALNTLIENPDIKVESFEPFPRFGDYNKVLAHPATAAFVLDQRMKGSGKVTYNGTDLARYLRGIDGKMPIYILTGHVDEMEEFEGSRHLVEYVFGKEEIDDVNSERAKVVKARMLRHLDVFNDVRDAQEQRFHDLLLKSMAEPLSEQEQKEMDQIEGETTAALVAAERREEREFGRKVEELKTLLAGGQLRL
jgi:hypothetical protein